MKLEMPDSNMSENSKYSLLLLGSVLLLVFVVLYIMQPLREDIQKNEQELTQAHSVWPVIRPLPNRIRIIMLLQRSRKATLLKLRSCCLI